MLIYRRLERTCASHAANSSNNPHARKAVGLLGTIRGSAHCTVSSFSRRPTMAALVGGSAAEERIHQAPPLAEAVEVCERVVRWMRDQRQQRGEVDQGTSGAAAEAATANTTTAAANVSTTTAAAAANTTTTAAAAANTTTTAASIGEQTTGAAAKFTMTHHGGYFEDRYTVKFPRGIKEGAKVTFQASMQGTSGRLCVRVRARTCASVWLCDPHSTTTSRHLCHLLAAKLALQATRAQV